MIVLARYLRPSDKLVQTAQKRQNKNTKTIPIMIGAKLGVLFVLLIVSATIN
jgi:hypothetical protein